MATRDFLTHTVSTSEPTGSALGDEWYNPSTNKIYKRLAVSGTAVQFRELPSALTVQSSGTTIASSTSVLNFVGYSIAVDSTGAVNINPPAAAAAGANTQVQFNNAGVLAGSAGFTFNSSTNLLTATGDVNLLGNTGAAKVLTLSPNTTGGDTSSQNVIVRLGNPIGGNPPNTSGVELGTWSGAPTGLARIYYNNGGASTGLEINAGNSITRFSNQSVANHTLISTAGNWNFATNVGIGFATPDQPLAFADSVSVKIQFNGSNTNGYQVGLATAVNSGDAMMKFTAGETGAGEFGFYQTTNLNVIINRFGNVGIGNSTPSYKLQVGAAAGTAASILTALTPVLYVDGGSTANSSIVIKTHSPGNGNINGAIKFAVSPDSTNYSWSGVAGIADANSAASSLAFYTATGNTQGTAAGASTERMRIDINGRVVIGATSTNSRLQSSGAAQTTSPTGGSSVGSGLYITNTDTNYGMMFGVSSSGNGWIQQQRSDAVSTQYALTLNPIGGNVGIGSTTTPQYRLDVNNGATGSNSFQASFGATISSGLWSGIHFGYSEAANTLYRKSAIVFERSDGGIGDARGKIHILNATAGSASATLADARITIGTTGNVGIGQTNPVAKFEVSGAAGQLFSVTDSMTGTIFSVNDISGIPSIEVLDTGVVKMAEYSGFVAYGVTQAATAAGTTQATATLIVRPITNVSTVAANTGVVLPIATPGMRIMIRNGGINSLRIYPAVGAQINALGTNTFYALDTLANLEFVSFSTTQWYSVNSTFA